jgi:hypothetical protein
MLRSAQAHSSRVMPGIATFEGPPAEGPKMLLKKFIQPPYFSGNPPRQRIRFEATTFAWRSVGVWTALTPGINFTVEKGIDHPAGAGAGAAACVAL